jgi:hypothetical protein
VVACLAVVASASTGATGGPAGAQYAFEIWYDLRPELAGPFDEYFRRLEVASVAAGRPVERWVDASHQGSRRIVTLPASSLSAFGSDRYNESVLRAAFGDDTYRALTAQYDRAQLSRTSFIRRYRDELSLRRQRHARAGLWGTAYTLVDVGPGREREFERLWRRAMEAHGRLTPDLVLSVSETIAGGGPRYLIAQPVGSADDSRRLAYDDVAAALPPRDAASFVRGFRDVVIGWETAVYARTSMDADAAARD